MDIVPDSRVVGHWTQRVVLTSSYDTYFDYFPGVVPVDDDIVARAYAKSVEGAQTGQVYPVV